VPQNDGQFTRLATLLSPNRSVRAPNVIRADRLVYCIVPTVPDGARETVVVCTFSTQRSYIHRERERKEGRGVNERS